jgi:hypothetical protein
LAKSESDILEKCFHKPREVLHCEMQRGRALDSENVRLGASEYGALTYHRFTRIS